MLKYSLILIFTVVCNAQPLNPRIVNGTDASEGEFPYVVSLRNYIYHTCGATILNENFILTAAHCVCDNSVPLDPSGFTIQYGSVKISADNRNSIQVKKIYCNNFDFAKLIFDSAVLELESPIPDDGTWEPVKLATKFEVLYDKPGVIVGWGRLSQDGPSPEILQKLNVEIYADFACGLEFNIQHHICFGSANGVGGACNGDSGTALIVEDHQVGIASFITNTCGIADISTPNVYSRVSTYYDWIAGIAGLN